MSADHGPRRVGLFGGAFDPPHLAHVALARAAIEQLGLDELRILPTGQAWHKRRPLSDAIHRVAMAQLAFAPLAQAVVDPRETRRSGPSYTIDTLQELLAEQPHAEFFLLLGGDQWAAFDGWQRWQELARLAQPVVLARPGALPPAPRRGVPVPHMLALAPLCVSATAIREALAQGRMAEAAQHLPEPVARYISTHCLYGNPPPGRTAPHA